MQLITGLLILPFYIVRDVVLPILKALLDLLEWGFQLFSGHKDSPVHGDAAWAPRSTLKDAGHFQEAGWLVGLLDSKRIYTKKNASVLCIAPKGQGKTLTQIAAALNLIGRSHKDDLVIFDPAGDIEPATRPAAETAGYKVLRLDLEDPRNGNPHNVMSFLRPHDVYGFEKDLAKFSELVLPDDAKMRDEHWVNMGRKLLIGTIVGMLERDSEMPKLDEVVDLLITDARQRRLAFEMFSKCSNPIVKAAVNAFEEAGDRERGSFSTTLARKLGLWQRLAVRAATQNDGWTWEQVFDEPEPVVVYLKTGLGDDEGGVARLLLGNAINTRRRRWNEIVKTPGVKFPKGLRILCDETALLGHCQALLDANAELRKADTSTWLTFQTIADIRNIYARANTLVVNSDLMVFGGSNEMELNEQISKVIGDTTIESGSRSENSSGSSVGVSEQGRRLIKADQIRRLAFEDVLLVMGGRAVKAKKAFKITRAGIRYL
jgi:type IV secretory pathway TraG/TraD family ATPase VirD4